jgi:hypothetical protein
MSCKQKNFGIAKPKVELLDDLPNTTKQKKIFNFDINALQWDDLNKSGFFTPVLTEYIRNKEGTWAACFPAKRKFHVNNKLEITSSSSTSRPDLTVFWKPMSLSSVRNLYFKDHIYDSELPSYYTDVPVTKTSRSPKSGEPRNDVDPLKKYVGPIWRDTTYSEEALPRDDFVVRNFKKFLAGTSSSSSRVLGPSSAPPEDSPDGPTTPTTPTTPTPPFSPDPPKGKPSKPISRSSVLQTRLADGLWWGIDSDNDFIGEDDMAFGVTIEIPQEPPPEYQFPTCFSIVFGGSTSSPQKFELFLKLNTKPILIDYYGVSGGFSGDDNKITLGADLSLQSGEYGNTDIVYKSRLDVQFMTCGGRIIVFVNGKPNVYERVNKRGRTSVERDKIGSIRPCAIKKGKISVFGTNSPANVYAYPLSFAEESFMCFPILAREGSPSTRTIDYSAVDSNGNATGEPVAVFPSGATSFLRSKQIYGVDCAKFTDANKSCSPSGIGVHAKPDTEIDFYSTASFLAKSKIESRYDNVDYYILRMKPSDFPWKSGTALLNRAPFFFKLKGVSDSSREKRGIRATDVTSDLLTLSEKCNAPDYFHIEKSANFTLYNENGKYNYLADKQQGVRISWSWNGKGSVQTFIGLTISVDFTHMPGKEEVAVNCQDYNYILQNVPILNSPIYDGMLGSRVILDLAERAGIHSPRDDIKTKTKYFLPSGYTFTQPRYRFSKGDMIKEKMIEVTKLFEAYFYFDGFGVFHIDKLPGGLLGDGSFSGPTINFSSNPLDSTAITILEKKSINVDFSETVNTVTAISADRDTRSPLMYSEVASTRDKTTFSSPLGKLLFKKVMLLRGKPYGGMSEMKQHVGDLSKSVYFPVRKTSFQTVGENTVIQPLTFITVDGIRFRLLSVNRSYDASKNTFTSDYESEFLNGK